MASNSDLALVPTIATPQEPDTAAGKKPRVLTKALRSLSSSSVDSMPIIPLRSSSSQRRLQKTSSGSGSMIERFQRRVSRDSPTVSPSDALPSPLLETPYASMEILKCVTLKQDQSSRKNRADYLVLTDQCLSRFASFEAARLTFPQLAAREEPAIGRSGSSASISSRTATESRLEIPLLAVVAVFVDVPAATTHFLDVWWMSHPSRPAYNRAQLSFSTARDRDEWLIMLHRICRQKMRQSSSPGVIPDNIKSQIRHFVAEAEEVKNDDVKIPIFPVVRRSAASPRSPSDEASTSVEGGSSFYLAIGPLMCHLVEIRRLDSLKPTADLNVRVSRFGTVTLARFQASVASHQQTFVMTFRLPFGKETRLALASIHYRRIIETVMKTDRILKPTWPQHLQQAIFDIRGLSPPLQLTSGNDYGGFDISLPAYCAAFAVPAPRWSIDWTTPSSPCFCLMPPEHEACYSPLQLLAVFRALRYNGFFKAVSFADVDLTPLAGKQDSSQYGDSVVYYSANRIRMPEDLYEIMSEASVLEQEIHSLLFASDSIRSINLSNVLGLYHYQTRQRLMITGVDKLEKHTSELLRPIMELLKRQLSHCHSIILSGNPICTDDAEELRDTLNLRHVRLRRLELADCGLTDFALSDLWTALDRHADTLEIIDLSNNQGTARFEIVCNALSRLSRVNKLCIARSVRLASELSLFDDEALANWHLRELDMSGVMLNDATVDSLANYLSNSTSQSLGLLRLNNSGLTGAQMARLFRGMGRDRDMELYTNSNKIDDGITDLSDALAAGFGPLNWSLQIIDFSREESYITLLRGLAPNTSIKCLSLAGTSLPDAASETACQAVFEFLANNTSVRFLDMSGYDSKLDEGRLGRGFSRALGGIRHNTQLEHLRVRNQMLNINVGDLADALAVNKTLCTVDCEFNDFTLSNLRYLITKLERNTSIRIFSAFASEELSRTMKKSMADAATPAPAKRVSMMSRFRSEKSNQSEQDASLIQVLKTEWDDAVTQLRAIADRNFGAYSNTMIADTAAIIQSHQALEADSAFVAVFDGLAMMDWKGLQFLVETGSAEASQSASMHARTNSSRSTAERLDSLDSSEAAASHSSEAGSSESGAATPLDVDYSVETVAGLQNDLDQWKIDCEGPDNNYIYADSQDTDGGLQMKRYRKFPDEAINRIDEEDHVYEADKTPS